MHACQMHFAILWIATVRFVFLVIGIINALKCYRDFANCLDECINDKTILILKTHSDPIWSHTFNWGGQATAADFELGSNTQVSYSCSVTFKNEFYVFGGLNLSHQISKINGCSLGTVNAFLYCIDVDFREYRDSTTL